MKTECAKVSTHNKLVACILAGLTAMSAIRLGNTHGWSGANPGAIDNVAIAMSVVGFAVAVFCVLAVPINRVAWARLASGALFAAYGYLTLADDSSRGWTAFYAVAAVTSCWRLIERGLAKELERL